MIRKYQKTSENGWQNQKRLAVRLAENTAGSPKAEAPTGAAAGRVGEAGEQFSRRPALDDPLARPAAGFCEMFGGCATARLELPNGIPRGHCAYNPAYDHDSNGLTCEPGRNHPVP